jgi:hypothetical protein
MHPKNGHFEREGVVGCGVAGELTKQIEALGLCQKFPWLILSKLIVRRSRGIICKRAGKAILCRLQPSLRTATEEGPHTCSAGATYPGRTSSSPQRTNDN